MSDKAKIDRFFAAMREGATAAIMGEDYVDCPYGLPSHISNADYLPRCPARWVEHATRLVCDPDPQAGGWLYGWQLFANDEVVRRRGLHLESVFYGAWMTAACLRFYRHE